MTELVLEYNERNITANKIVDFILSLELFRVKSTDKSSAIDKALLEEKQGKTTTYNSVDDFKQAIKQKLYV
jgi:hypothetical protein